MSATIQGILPTIGVITFLGLAACGAIEEEQSTSGKQQLQPGSLELTITSDSVRIPDDFGSWQSNVTLFENPDGTFHFTANGGAASASTSATSGFGMAGEVDGTLSLVGDFDLPSWDTRGERNQVNLTVEGTSWTSTSGTLAVSRFDSGIIEGTWTATLVDVSDQAGILDIVASFTGSIGTICNIYDESADGLDGPSWRQVDISDPACSALFD